MKNVDVPVLDSDDDDDGSDASSVDSEVEPAAIPEGHQELRQYFTLDSSASGGESHARGRHVAMFCTTIWHVFVPLGS